MADDLIGKVVADKYRIESFLREGESGDLFTARHEIRDTDVLISILPQAISIDPRWVKRFIDEARRASLAAAPNILNITDFGTDAQGLTYAVYEPINGEALSDLLKETETFDQDRAIDIARQIATGVAAAHEKNGVHGRLRPDNIFVRRDEFEREIVKVFGFGADPNAIERNADIRYLAPEQLGHSPAADSRTDVYAIGVILFRMLSGVLPFDAADAAGLLQKIDSEPPAPLSAYRHDLHPEIEPIILTSLAADPDRRYQTVTAFAEDLALAAGQPVLAKPDAVLKKKHSPWTAGIVVAAGVVILASALIYATSVKKTDVTAQLQAEPGMLPVQPIGPATGAQEESLSKMPDLTPEDVAAMQAGTMAVPPGTLPGGDGYNAWSNGGAPPLGAPPASTGGVAPVYVAPPGQTVTIDPNGGSQFMPQSEGVILVPVPRNDTNTAPTTKPTPTPKSPTGNTAVPATTPKPMATPIPKPSGTQPKPAASPKKGGKPADLEDE
jgi:hypothetical protein